MDTGLYTIPPTKFVYKSGYMIDVLNCIQCCRLCGMYFSTERLMGQLLRTKITLEIAVEGCAKPYNVGIVHSFAMCHNSCMLQ